MRERRLRADLLDLTESNPTRVGLPYPTEALRAAIARADPARLRAGAAGAAGGARGGGGGICARPAPRVDPARVALTASSSESCSFLFKLLCDPGDAVLIPEPSYPLYDYLVRLEGAVPIAYRLTFDGAWRLDFASIERALAQARGRGARPRAVVVASPNNPTGRFAKRDEAGAARRRRGARASWRSSPTRCSRAYAARARSHACLARRDRACAGGRRPRLQPGRAVEVLRTAAPEARLDRRRRTGDATRRSPGWSWSPTRTCRSARPSSRRCPSCSRLARESAPRSRRGSPPTARQLGAGSSRRSGHARCCRREAGWSAIVRVPAVRSDEAWAAEPGHGRGASSSTPDTSSTFGAERSWWSACCPSRRPSPKPSDE